jgi:hypothetical protein
LARCFFEDVWRKGEEKAVIDLVAINRRLANRRFLSGPSDESFFSHLTCQIQGLARPGEKLVIPDFAEADAWAKAWQLYQALLSRKPEPVAVQAEAEGRTAAAVSRRMGEFAADRQGLIHFRDRNRAQWADLCEYVGLRKDDLVEGERDQRFGVEVDWADKAERLAHALRRLEGMSPAEKADAHRVVEERRRVAILKAHDQDIDNLRDMVRQLAQRLEAIESRLPPQKEVISAMVA